MRNSSRAGRAAFSSYRITSVRVRAHWSSRWPVDYTRSSVRSLGTGSTAIVMGAGPIGLAVLTVGEREGRNGHGVGTRRRTLRVGCETRRRLRDQSQGTESRRQGARLTGRSPELIFECIGVKGTLGSAIDMVGPRGTIVVVGVCMEPDQIMPLSSA